MSAGCPGSDGRNLSTALYRCAHCGAEVEMFSDEIRVRCPACGAHVCKDSVPSCVQWCAKARECIGEERWLALHPDDGEAGGAAQTGRAAGNPADQKEPRHE